MGSCWEAFGKGSSSPKYGFLENQQVRLRSIFDMKTNIMRRNKQADFQMLNVFSLPFTQKKKECNLEVAVASS